MTKKSSIEWHGHRGCRGLLPENSLPAFMKAIELGMDALEMDVCISADKQVVIAHEPYMPADICLRPDGQSILVEEERTHNLYQLPYSDIALYNCGLKHPRFDEQQAMPVMRPLLKDLFEQTEAYQQSHDMPEVDFTIELKSEPEYDGIYHPAPEEYVSLVLAVIEDYKLSERCVLQSFDYRILREIRRQAPHIRLSMLLSDAFELQAEINKLGFKPEIVGPQFSLVDNKLISDSASLDMKVIPWTVNEVSDMEQLIALGVDGIITDYPDRKALVSE